MEEAVSSHLSSLGYTITARQMVGNFTVALTCQGEGGRLAVETDGDGRYDREVITDELNKQSVLERVGWRFLRLRASEYYRDPEGYLERLAQTVAAAGVRPGKAGAEKTDLSERVIARAKELVAEWDAQDAAGQAESAESEEELFSGMAEEAPVNEEAAQEPSGENETAPEAAQEQIPVQSAESPSAEN